MSVMPCVPSVGADADKGGVPERYKPAVAADEIESHCGDREHHHAGKEPEQVTFRPERSCSGNQCQDEKYHRRQQA